MYKYFIVIENPEKPHIVDVFKVVFTFIEMKQTGVGNKPTLFFVVSFSL